MDPAVAARRLALKFVAEDADRGISEHSIRLSWHRSCAPAFYGNDPKKPVELGPYDVSIGGAYDFGPDGRARKKVPTTQVFVRQVNGVEGVWLFSLHELYQECLKGQLSLL